MALKIIETILWLILIFSLGKIIYILLKKFPLAASIDLNLVPKEKVAQTKEHLIKRRIQRKVNQQINSLNIKLSSWKDKFKK